MLSLSSLLFDISGTYKASLSWVFLCVIQLLVVACGERQAILLAPPPTYDSVLPCLHGCLIFLHRHFPPQFPSSHLLGLSPCSQLQTLPWDHSTIPMLRLPTTVPSRALCPCREWIWLWQVLSMWFSFLLDCHRAAFSLSASNASSLFQTFAPMWGLDPCFCSLTH